MQQQSGWYPDPDGTPGRLRWWDGQEWSDLTTQASTPTTGPNPGTPTFAGEQFGGDDNADVLVGPGGSCRTRRVDWRFNLPRWSPGRGWQIGGPLLALMLVLALVAVMGGGRRSDGGELAKSVPDPASTAPPTPDVPPLARLCQANQPTTPPAPASPSAPAPTGPRLVDREAGISYLRAGAPWQPWDRIWTGGVLGVEYRAGYFFVTQHDVAGLNGDYLATVLSGSVPATAGDALHPDMKCVARQVAEDARMSFYPQPNTQQVREDKPVVVDGHPGYLITFHLSFDVPGYDAKGELASVLLVDVGTPDVAVLYQSIPDTHRQYDPLIDQVIASVRIP